MNERTGIPTFSSHPFGRAASPAAVVASGQVVAPTTSAAADAALEQRIVTQNMWLRRIVVSVTFLGVGVTAGAVLGSLLPRRRDPVAPPDYDEYPPGR